ncbi:hypothetical protein PVAND_013758 [Polypedilum vanderplanki]|uniref:F-box domain-containing protein n=1 Tax=Polypedilum vanderplanki TaxID=319348 RepID=A0A9J6CQC9_POLVA|nr:hypothetical protein PVAND_013758 [Polypedilum vanderplanki]
MDVCETTSSNPFHQLPDELIHNIFTYLDKKSIKNFALSFKRSAAVLSTSTNLLNKYFKLKLENDFWQDREKIFDLLSLRRNLRELELSNIAGSHNVLIAIFKRFGLHITKLKISNSKIDDFTLREILRLSPMLQELHVSEIGIIKKLPAINPIFMSYLKRLTVQYCDWIILKFIMRSQIHSLTIKSYLDEGNRIHLVDFLSSQFLLKELMMQGTSIRCLFQNNDISNNCAYSLNKFAIDNTIGKNSDTVNFNISTFMNLHDSTLKCVEISGPNMEHVTAFVLLNLKMIQDLILDVRSLPKDQNFYYALAEEEKCTTLQNLKLCGFFFQQELVKSILLQFPMIQNLEINDWSNGSVSDLLQFISQNLPHIENLTITEISNGEDIKLNALTNLTVQYIRNTNQLSKFIIKNEKIEALKVNLVYIGQVKNLVTSIRDLSNLKYLSIGGNKKALNMIMNLIHANAPQKLQTLELSMISDEKGGNDARKAIKLNFPLNRNEIFKFNVLI